MCTYAHGRHLAHITHHTEPVHFLVSGNHHETLRFYVFSAPLTPIVLGFPRLVLHNPLIDWAAHKIISWSTFCHQSCLNSALPPTDGVIDPTPPPPDLSTVPEVYHVLGEAFSKIKALSLSPHRPYDCAI